MYFEGREFLLHFPLHFGVLKVQQSVRHHLTTWLLEVDMKKLEEVTPALVVRKAKRGVTPKKKACELPLGQLGFRVIK